MCRCFALSPSFFRASAVCSRTGHSNRLNSCLSCLIRQCTFPHVLHISIQCPLEYSAATGSYNTVVVARPLLGDFTGKFSANFQFCPFALDGSKLESGGHCMYRVTTPRGDVTQESSKVSHRSTFGLACNSSSLITFTCAQACVVSVLVTSSAQNSLPVLEVQASAHCSCYFHVNPRGNSLTFLNRQLRRPKRHPKSLQLQQLLPPLFRLHHQRSQHGTFKG